MFETIVWATDGSDLANHALPLVTDLARTHDSKIVVVHANEVIVGRFGGVPMLADEDELRERFAQQVADLSDAGYDAELRIETGVGRGPAASIAKAAAEVDAGVIVVGTHGRGIAGAVLLGSVAKALLHIAPCPVLVVTPVRIPVA
jgi:nucleotide-binding universal stress UspA family protein